MKHFTDSWSITKELFDWIRGILPEGKIILELGSGKGTVGLLEYYKVYSIEHNRSWVGYAKEGNYIYAPIVNYGSYHWYDVNKLKNLPGYDLLLIDGPPGIIGRRGIIQHRNLFDMSVPVVIGDTHRRQEQMIAAEIAALYGKKIEKHGNSKKKFTTLI